MRLHVEAHPGAKLVLVYFDAGFAQPVRLPRIVRNDHWQLQYICRRDRAAVPGHKIGAAHRLTACMRKLLTILNAM